MSERATLTVVLRVPTEPVWENVGPCPECFGSLWTEDEDGSLTGTVGTVVPCQCVMLDEDIDRRPGCGCVEGWIQAPPGELYTESDDPILWPCTRHTTTAVAVAGVA